jgi:protein-disulfide isomerase
LSAFVTGALSLLGCILLSAALTAEHLGQLALPGCGPQSACARIAATAWGHLPVVDWPVAFLGLSYFLGLALAWSRCRSSIPTTLLHVVRLGAAVSVLLTGVMLFEGLLCGYCLATHAAHLVFCIAAHRLPRRASLGATPLVLLMGSVAATSAVLFQWRATVETRTEAEQERQLASSTAEIVASASAAQASDAPYQARYPAGPEQAAVRVVVFSDFQCEDCKRVHEDLEGVLEEHANVSVALHHFPMCVDCNPSAPERNMHPNACWAARAAEAAGMLHGTPAFWEISHWLFERNGGFTKAELDQYLLGAGYDVAEFRGVMEGPQTLQRISADIDEALRRGLHFTPMLFVNGIDLRGVLATDAVPRAIEQVLATHPEPAAATADVVQSALEKHLTDWRVQPRRNTGVERSDWRATPADARVKIVIWGDYQEKHTATADRILRDWANSHAGTSYSFRYFPTHSECNTGMSRVMHPNACLMARAAEAAKVLGDEAQYWQMHAWLFEQQQGLTLARVLQSAGQLAFDPIAFEQAMGSPAVAATIEADAKQGFSMLHHGVIPAIYIDGKVVPRWRVEGENVLETILDGLD